jgi:RNA polymerase sigma-70 factor (ECF subfamily)
MDELTRDLVAARDGDRVAFAAFVRRSQAEVWRFCAHLGGSAEADDLTQETFVRVVRALPSFRADASARTWLLAIARRVCADSIRRTVRERRRAAAVRPPAPVTDATPGSAIEDLVHRLDPDQRSAFVLTQLLGLEYAEAAEVCGVPVGTIRSRVARGREQLIVCLRAADAV